MFILKKLNVRTVQLICILTAVGSLANPSWWPWLALSLCIYTVIFIFGVAIGFHRGLTHRMLPEDSVGMWICLGLGTIATLGRPMDWVFVHRLHHQTSDSDADPHSPVYQGFWTVFLNIWHLKKSTVTTATGAPAEKSPGTRRSITLLRDVLSLKSAKFYQHNYYYVIGAYIFVCAVFGGWPGVIFGYCWPAAMSVLGTSLVNAVCHSNGQARDHLGVSLYTFGEGIHGRHHDQPMARDLTHGRYFDVSGWFLTRLWPVKKAAV